MKRIYLDHAATTPMLDVVKNTMIEYMEIFGNASSLHAEGRVAKKAIAEARCSVAELIGAQPDEIIFTSGGSEANNIVINSFDRVAVSAIEHPSVLAPADKKGATIIPMDSKGRVVLDEYAKIVSHAPELVSVMLANNEIGTLQDIPRLAEIAHNSDTLFHTDAVQAVGKIPVDVDQLEVDYLTLSAHKIGGPKGVGALYVRSGSPIKPLILGGHQESGLRAGTENVLAIIGFGVAAKHLKLFQNARLKNKLRDGIIAKIPNVTVNGDQENCLPNILNVTFAGCEGESIMLMLDEAGVAVSTGSACASGDIKSSHVLMAIGADPEKAHGSIRFSLGADTTDQEIEYVLKILPPIVKKLRKISTIGGKYE